jgi:hypothetical protein
LAVRAGANTESVGRAVHAFFAADQPGLGDAARLALAGGILARFALTDHIGATELVAAGTRLWRWIEATLAPTRIHREWPLVATLPDGSLVTGAADLVVRNGSSIAIIDHKTFGAGVARATEYSGQLALYARAIGAALGDAITTWIHLPVMGVVVEVRT